MYRFSIYDQSNKSVTIRKDNEVQSIVIKKYATTKAELIKSLNSSTERSSRNRIEKMTCNLEGHWYYFGVKGESKLQHLVVFMPANRSYAVVGYRAGRTLSEDRYEVDTTKTKSNVLVWNVYNKDTREIDEVENVLPLFNKIASDEMSKAELIELVNTLNLENEELRRQRDAAVNEAVESKRKSDRHYAHSVRKGNELKNAIRAGAYDADNIEAQLDDLISIDEVVEIVEVEAVVEAPQINPESIETLDDESIIHEDKVQPCVSGESETITKDDLDFIKAVNREKYNDLMDKINFGLIKLL